VSPTMGLLLGRPPGASAVFRSFTPDLRWPEAVQKYMNPNTSSCSILYTFSRRHSVGALRVKPASPGNSVGWENFSASGAELREAAKSGQLVLTLDMRGAPHFGFMCGAIAFSTYFHGLIKSPQSRQLLQTPRLPPVSFDSAPPHSRMGGWPPLNATRRF